MTAVSQIITDAFRQSNLLALGVAPTSLQQDEALRYLQRILKSVFGNEAGEPLSPIPVGSKGYERPSGYPWWDTVPDNDWFVPKNIRLVLNLENPQSVYLTPQPDDGTRFGVIDVSNNLFQNNLRIYGNGANIENSTDIILDVNGYSAEWFYRADLGNWVRYTPITITDAFPFPEEFDDFFITMLAMRLNPSYGAAIDQQSTVMLDRARSHLRTRYNQNIEQRSELALIRPAKTAQDRDQWSYSTFYQPNSMFDKGWPF